MSKCPTHNEYEIAFCLKCIIELAEAERAETEKRAWEKMRMNCAYFRDTKYTLRCWWPDFKSWDDCTFDQCPALKDKEEKSDEKDSCKGD